MSVRSNKAQRPSVPGVIDTLSTGFVHVNRMLWIVLLPAMVDLFLWRGPQLSAGPLGKRLLNWYAQFLPWYLEQTQAPAASVAEGVRAFEENRPMWQSAADHFNLFSLVTLNIASVPSVMVGQRADGAMVIEIDTLFSFLLILVALELLGILLGCLYLGLIAQQVRDGVTDLGRLRKAIRRYWFAILGFWGLAIGAFFAVLLPLAMLLGVVQLVSPGLSALLALLVLALGQMAIIVLVILLFFFADAVVISEVGTLRAISSSIKVVARNYWSALGLIALIYIIMLGTQVIWSNVTGQGWGAVVGIVGNAYIASGLTAASMTFYRHRIALLTQPSGVGPDTSEQGGPAATGAEGP